MYYIHIPYIFFLELHTCSVLETDKGEGEDFFFGRTVSRAVLCSTAKPANYKGCHQRGGGEGGGGNRDDGWMEAVSSFVFPHILPFSPAWRSVQGVSAKVKWCLSFFNVFVTLVLVCN